MGTGPSAANPSSFDLPRPSNNSCKTFDAQQICIGETERAELQLTAIVPKQVFGQTVATNSRKANVANTDGLFYSLLGRLFALTICRLAYVVIVEIVRERMEEQQGGRANGAVLTTAEEEAGSFHRSRLLAVSLFVTCFCSF